MFHILNKEKSLGNDDYTVMQYKTIKITEANRLVLLYYRKNTCQNIFILCLFYIKERASRAHKSIGNNRHYGNSIMKEFVPMVIHLTGCLWKENGLIELSDSGQSD